MEPVHPVGPRKLMNMAMAGVLGRDGQCVVFFLEFSRRPGSSQRRGTKMYAF
jgi:hypothetical protein